MLPDPLHPAVVHLPVALAMLMPFLALASIVAIGRGWLPVRSWAGVVALQVVLAASAWAAMETGHHEEERVERVVAKRYIHEHEEAAEWFVGLAAATVVVAATGLLTGGPGRAGRIGAVAAMAIVLAAAARTGHLGGELVYRHGAAAAYTEDEDATTPPSAAAARSGEEP